MQETINKTVVIVETETTGFVPTRDNIVAISAIKLENGEKIGKFYSLIDPEKPIPQAISRLIGLTDEDLQGQPLVDEVMTKFAEFCQDHVLVAYNAAFIMPFIQEACKSAGICKNFISIDLLEIFRILYPTVKKHTLKDTCAIFDIPYENNTAGSLDAEIVAKLYCRLVSVLIEKKVIWTS